MDSLFIHFTHSATPGRKATMDFSLPALDTATKYPSIPTYHVIGERGMLGEDTNVVFEAGEDVYLTEKVDGTNCRIVVLPGGGDFLIGTRDLFLYAQGDRVPNQVPVNLEILRTLMEPAAAAADAWTGKAILVVFCEVYGAAGIARGWADYTGTKTGAGARMFDTATVDPAVLGWELDRIAGWRERGGQGFAPACFNPIAQFGLEPVPHVKIAEGHTIPTGREAAEAWMEALLPGTLAGLGDGGTGNAEGIVARTADRSKIVKLRKAEYAKTRRQLANRR
ncbi:RNA ligase family protein [Glycomyces sp. A-F 0318]|uniref:RNA ligase family protein n=1 Tax=Glycomyces amatae TaxID=2881355 RepID=UPI001E30134E|nr:RNA ligase family protein [Glycomyces amatae]MCD0446255.1 RNA ligase family protein [Glycomyces amatae]